MVTIRHDARRARRMVLEAVRQGFCRFLQMAVELEADWLVEQHARVRDDRGKRQVVRNGYLPARRLRTALGKVEIRVPRVRDNRPAAAASVSLSSRIVPPYVRKGVIKIPTTESGALALSIYLRAMLTGKIDGLLSLLSVSPIEVLAPAVVAKLQQWWRLEYRRRLDERLPPPGYACVCFDEIAMAPSDPPLLVVVAKKAQQVDALGVRAERRLPEDWSRLLIELRRRGLTSLPREVVGDALLAVWKPLAHVYAPAP